MFRNTLFFSIASMTGLVFSFILAPIMLARLGLEQYGVWAVTGAFAAYVGLIDLGISRSLGRFVAVYHARDEPRVVEQCLGLGLIAATIVGAVAAAVAVLAAPAAAGALGDVLTPSEMRAVLLSSAVILGALLFSAALDAVPQGLARYGPPSTSDFASHVLNFSLSVAALLWSRDLVVYAVANAVAGVVSIAFSIISMRIVWGRVSAAIPSRALVREVLGFSLKSQASWIADLVNGQAAKIVLAFFVDVRVAGAFDVAFRAAQAAKHVGLLSMSALIPTATAQITREGARVIGGLYVRYSRRSMAITMPMIVFLCASAPALLVAWLGEVPDDALGVFIALTLGMGVSLTTGVSSQLALSEGRAGAIAWLSAFTAAVTIVSMLVLGPFFELWGIVAGILLGIVAGSVAWLRYWHRLHDLPASAYVNGVGAPTAMSLLAAVPLAAWWLLTSTAVDGRPSAILITLGLGVVFAGIYWPLATRWDLLPEQLRMRGVRRVRQPVGPGAETRA